MRVLIVEDDRSVGTVLQDFLFELGHESELVLSAEGALDRLQQNRPDLVLLDFRLPGMNGLDFLHERQVRDSRIPVIDRKSTRLNSSHVAISYAVFCLKKK